MRKAAALLLPLILSLALAAPARAADRLRVGKAIAQSFSFSLLDLGVAHGIFARHGLEVESISFAGAAKLGQAMAAGSVDIGLDNGSDMAFIAKGAPEKAVAAMAGAPVDICVAVAKDSPIGSVDGLKGKKVGVSSPGSITAMLTVELSKHQGWGLDGITVLTTGSPPTSMALLKTGQLDGATLDLGYVLQAERHGEARLLARLGDLLPDFHTYVIVATDALIAARPDAVRRFLAGWFETVAFARANKDATVDGIAATLRDDRALIAQLYDQLMPMYSSDGRFEAKALDALAQTFLDVGTLDKKPDMAKLYTEDFLPGR